MLIPYQSNYQAPVLVNNKISACQIVHSIFIPLKWGYSIPAKNFYHNFLLSKKFILMALALRVCYMQLTKGTSAVSDWSQDKNNYFTQILVK